MKVKDIFLAIFVALAWGSYFVVSKIAFSSFPPMLFASLRFFLLFCLTMPFLFKNKIPIKKVLYLSIVTSLNMLLLNYAINISNNIAPIILISELSVPISILLGVLFLKEEFSFQHVLGIIIALIGSYIVIINRSIENVGVFAVVLTIGAAFLFACYNLLAKLLSIYNSFEVLVYLSLFIFPQLLIISFLQEEWPQLENIKLSSIYALLYITIICTLVSYYVWFYLLDKYEVSKVVPFTLLSPIFGCFITKFILDEHISTGIVFGGLLVVIGIGIIEFKKIYVKKEL